MAPNVVLVVVLPEPDPSEPFDRVAVDGKRGVSITVVEVLKALKASNLILIRFRDGRRARSLISFCRGDIEVPDAGPGCSVGFSLPMPNDGSGWQREGRRIEVVPELRVDTEANCGSSFGRDGCFGGTERCRPSRRRLMPSVGCDENFECRGSHFEGSRLWEKSMARHKIARHRLLLTRCRDRSGNRARQ